ncbi:alpha/beta hydrolase [Legionella sp.]|uniref:alpha/beta fold hydrolase n=1 Tax=Legionella sp. TaxID=459 RepID=UPI0032206EA4
MSSTLNYAPDKYVAINDLSIRYRAFGDGGETLVLIHGLGASLEHWYQLAPLLAENYKLILLDLPGAGRSSKPKLHYSISFYLELLEQFMAKLSLEQVSLLGHSFGGGLALQYVLEKRAGIKNLILLSNAGFSRKIKLLYRLLTIPLLNRILTTLNRNGVRDSLHMNVVDNQTIEAHFIDEMYAISQLPGFGHAVRSSLSASSNIWGIKTTIYKRINTKLNELSIPTLVLWGDSDPVLPFEWQQLNLQKLPNAKVKVINKAGHLLYLEQPKEVVKNIKAFLSPR